CRVMPSHVRFGSDADMASRSRDVRSTSHSRYHRATPTSGPSRIEDLDLLVRAFRFELLRSWIGWEDTKLAQQNRPGVSNRVLHARRKDQDIAGAVSLRAILSSRLAPARENDD